MSELIFSERAGVFPMQIDESPMLPGAEFPPSEVSKSGPAPLNERISTRDEDQFILVGVLRDTRSGQGYN